MCVTKDGAERTGIVNLSDLTDPEMAKNVDSDCGGKGEVWIGVVGRASANVEKMQSLMLSG